MEHVYSSLESSCYQETNMTTQSRENNNPVLKNILSI